MNGDVKKMVCDELQVLCWGGERENYKLFDLRKNREVCKDEDLQWQAGSNYSFANLFYVNSLGEDPLPEIRSLDKEQRKVVFSRKQYHKIRGIAGSGKTTAMLWHAVFALIRMRQPVLLVCKTRTLTQRNRKRIVASLKKECSWLEEIEKNMIVFKTVDDALCDLAKDADECKMRKLPKGSILSNDEKDKCCKTCKRNLVGKSTLPSEVIYGSVLADELQSLEPDKINALYRFTGKYCPMREFYVFCDEKQSLMKEAVEYDMEEQCYRVKPPNNGKGFGRWITLSSPHRQATDPSGALETVALKIQGLLDSKYGVSKMDRRIYQSTFDFGAFRIRAIDPSERDIEEELRPMSRNLQEYGAQKITVIFEKIETIRGLFEVACREGWYTTHLRNKDYEKEKQLRAAFKEKEGVQLTTIDLAQGASYESTIVVFESEWQENGRNILEYLNTAVTRSTKYLRILDKSSTHWLYSLLYKYN